MKYLIAIIMLIAANAAMAQYDAEAWRQSEGYIESRDTLHRTYQLIVHDGFETFVTAQGPYSNNGSRDIIVRGYSLSDLSTNTSNTINGSELPGKIVVAR